MTTCECCGRVPPDHRDDCRVTFACERVVRLVEARIMALTKEPREPVVDPELARLREALQTAECFISDVAQWWEGAQPPSERRTKVALVTIADALAQWRRTTSDPTQEKL